MLQDDHDNDVEDYYCKAAAAVVRVKSFSLLHCVLLKSRVILFSCIIPDDYYDYVRY